MNHQRLLQAIPQAVKRALFPLLRRIYWVEFVLLEPRQAQTPVDYLPQQPVRPSKAVGEIKILKPAERVTIADPLKDPFVPISKYYRDGTFVRATIFTCHLPDARLHVGTGMVCTRDWEIVPDLNYRILDFPELHQMKPFRVKRLTGTYSTIFSWNGENFGHWMFDFLPRIHSLAKAEPEAKVTLIMPDFLRPALRESLECLLPRNFVLEYHPGESWLQLENFIWPTVVSDCCNFLLPTEYFDAIRKPIFAKFGLPAEHKKTKRIFVTRRHAITRRILNEAAVSSLLEQYGFESIELSELSFQQQVELFHQAEIVIGPHGAGLSSIVFSGDIRLVVLYATQVPQNHWHTLAKGLGQEHHFVLHHAGEDDDFTVDLQQLVHVLRNELGLKSTRTGR